MKGDSGKVHEGIEKEGEREKGRKEPDRTLSPLALFFNDGFNRADLGTGSTFRAFLFIDHIRFALFNCLDRTFLGTGSAGYALIGNDISHFDHLLLLNFEDFFFLGRKGGIDLFNIFVGRDLDLFHQLVELILGDLFILLKSFELLIGLPP
jgi:hypothetical protein